MVMQQSEQISREFPQVRACLLELAAFLDRNERAGQSHDYRVEALESAMELLVLEKEGSTERVKKILEFFSDPSVRPLEKAPTTAATGVAPRLG